MQTNIISHDELQTLLDTEFTETNAVRTGKVAPKGENIIIFKGLASQKYGKWEKNRNGYRIEPKGWQLENYVLNPIILLQHKADIGGIGHTIALQKSAEWLNIMYYIDLNAVADETTRYQIKNWYITGLSTGSMTISDAFEDQLDDYKMLTYNEAKDKYDGWEVFLSFFGMSEKLIYVVTEAELIENSQVTIGSNGKAISSQNNFQDYIQNKYSDLAEFNGLSMEEIKARVVNNTSDEPETEVEDTPAEPTTEAGKKVDMLEEVETVEENNTDEPEEQEEVAEVTDTPEAPETVEEWEKPTETSQEVEQETPVTEEVIEEVPEEVATPETTETETTAEEAGKDSWDATNGQEDIAGGKSSENAVIVDANVLELTNQITVKDNKIAELENKIAEYETLMEEALTTINELNAVVDRANEYVEKLGLDYVGDSNVDEAQPKPLTGFKWKLANAMDKRKQ